MKTTKKFGYYAFALLGATVLLFSSCNKDDEQPNTVTDIDGNEYKTVTIGSQVWMAENLKTTKYNTGTSIPNVAINTDWSNLTSGAYAWYQNNETSYKSEYGGMYNWYAVNTGSLCPTGWRVPTDADWTQLTDFVGSNPGTKLKAKSGWVDSGNGTDDYGFSALPGGYRYDGIFLALGNHGYWWSSNQLDATNAGGRSMHYDLGSVAGDNYNKKGGFNVRCVKAN
jgi:uncharacterized protein (TIGR02145 family)